jgi:uncharacterized integral membrane protein
MTSSDGTPIPASGPPDDERTPQPAHEQVGEPSRARLLRHARQLRLYSSATAVVALLSILILLISVNVRTVKIDWVIGSTRTSLVWIVLTATVLGWLLGIATSISFRYRTRRRQP